MIYFKKIDKEFDEKFYTMNKVHPPFGEIKEFYHSKLEEAYKQAYNDGYQKGAYTQACMDATTAKEERQNILQELRKITKKNTDETLGTTDIDGWFRDFIKYLEKLRK